MHTIKFRGKRIDNGEWVYGDMIRKRTWNKESEMETYISVLGKEKSFEVDPETVGQFTGLHDKNGKEVYEGDIIRDCENNKIEEVDGFDFSFGWKQHLNYKKVIGNKHENPELLKN